MATARFPNMSKNDDHPFRFYGVVWIEFPKKCSGQW